MQEDRLLNKGPIRRHFDSRYIGQLVGCYTLSERRGAAGEVKVFACRTRSISADHAVVDAPVVGDENERLTIRFDELGLLKGHIEDTRSDGFSIVFDVTDQERQRLARRVDWLKRRNSRAVVDRREYKRIMPRNPHAKLILGGEKPLDCLLIDISSSGAAVSAGICPAIGTPLAIGTIIGHVIRHFESGFAVMFDSLQDVDTLEPLLALATPEARARAVRVIWPALTAGRRA